MITSESLVVLQISVNIVIPIVVLLYKRLHVLWVFWHFLWPLLELSFNHEYINTIIEIQT